MAISKTSNIELVALLTAPQSDFEQALTGSPMGSIFERVYLRFPRACPLLLLSPKKIPRSSPQPALGLGSLRMSTGTLYLSRRSPDRLYRMQFSVWAIAPVMAYIECFLLDRTDAEVLPSNGGFDDLPAFVHKTKRSSADSLKSLRDRAKQSRFISRLYKRLYRV